MKWKQFSLRARIFLLLAAIVAATLGGGLVTMWYFSHMDSLFASIVDRDIAALDAATGLESSLVMQKGFVTYYFLDSDPSWLAELDKYHQAFDDWLRKAQGSSYLEDARNALKQIELEYVRYVYARDQVIQLYKNGEREAGMKLHRSVRGQFHSIYDLCEKYKNLHEQKIAQARSESRRQMHFIGSIALAVMSGVVLLGVLLSYILLRQVLGPIRKLAIATGATDDPAANMVDEVDSLSLRVHSLIEDVDQTQHKLKASREHLVQAEKLAMVGKLAAGVAHSIRNPLTSVKMRLFSLDRSLDLSPTQKEDFEVISEEIRHIDTIVRNFLEFSRRPKLKMQNISPSDVVDMALQLLRHRLESYGVEVEVERQSRLPEIVADPEQLKEVLVNLIINACEAMSGGGMIRIREEEGVTNPMGHVVVIRISDNGPGVPELVQDKVFQPFFSTKEEGTGLGLSIARRIIEDHRGCLNLRSKQGKGATFIITLPCMKEDRAWLRY